VPFHGLTGHGFGKKFGYHDTVKVRLLAHALVLAGLCAAASPELVPPLVPGANLTQLSVSGSGDWMATVSRPIGQKAEIQIRRLPDLAYLRSFSLTDVTAISAHPRSPLLAVARRYAVDVIDLTSATTTTVNQHLPDQITALAWLSDGRILAAGNAVIGRGALTAIDVTTGAASRLADFPGEIGDMQFLGSGKRLVVWQHARPKEPATVIVYETAGWKKIMRFTGLTGDVKVAIDSPESRIAAVSDDGILHLWSIDTYAPITKPVTLPLQASVPFGGFQEQADSIVFTADGKAIGFHTYRGFRIIDPVTGSVGPAFTDAPHYSTQNLTSAPAKKLVVGSQLFGALAVFDGSLMKVLAAAGPFRLATPKNVWFDAERILFAYGGFGTPEKAVWSFGSSVEKLTLNTEDPIGFVTKGSQPEILFADNGSVETIGSLNRLNVQTRARFSVPKPGTITSPHPQYVTADGRWMAAPNPGNGSVWLFDSDTKTEHTLPLKLPNSVMALSPKGNAIAIAEAPGPIMRVHIFHLPDLTETPAVELKRPEPVSTPGGPLIIGANRPYGVRSISFFADGSRMVIVDDAGQIFFWNFEKNALESRIAPELSNGLIALDTEGRRIAIAGADGKVSVRTPGSSGTPDLVVDSGSQVSLLKFRSDGKQLLIGTNDNLFRIHDLPSGRLAGTICVRAPQGPWMVWSDSGFFDSSEELFDQFVWRSGPRALNVASAATYFTDLYYPGISSRILRGEIPAVPPEMQRAVDLPGRIAFGATAKPAPDQRTTELWLTMPSNGGLRDVRLFRNGSLIQRWDGAVTGEVRTTVKLEAGANNFTAYGFNSARARSDPASITIQGGPRLQRPGTLHVLAIGINDYAAPSLAKLHFAVNDARMLAAALRGGREQAAEWAKQLSGSIARGETTSQRDQPAWLAASGPVDIKILADAEASRVAILQSIREISAAALPEDSFIMFFAGHGTADGQRYYLLPHDTKLNGPEGLKSPAFHTSAISDDDLALALKNLDVANSALIIDACESGQAVQAADDWRRGPIDANGLAQFAFEKGMDILAAAQSNQSAAELNKLEHGLLSWALVQEGLREGRAQPFDLRHWLAWTADRVPLLDLESIAALRGIVVNGDNDAAISGDVQKPTLLARERPDSIPLMISQGAVDLDPLTLTIGGTVSGRRSAPALGFSSKYLLPSNGPGNVTSFGIDPRGAWLFTVEISGIIRFWRPADLLPYRVVRLPYSIAGAALSPDGRTLACLVPYTGVVLVDVDTAKVRNTFAAGSFQYVAPRIGWSDDGRRLTVEFSDSIRILDAGSGKELRRFDSYGARFIWTAGDSMLALAAGGDIVSVDLTKNRGQAGIDLKQGLPHIIGSKAGLLVPAYDPARSLVLSAGKDAQLHFFDAARGGEIGQPIPASSAVNTMTFAHGRFFVAGEGGGVYTTTGPGAPLVLSYSSAAWSVDFLAIGGQMVAGASSASLATWKQGVTAASAVVRQTELSEYLSVSGDALTISGELVKSIVGGMPRGDLFRIRATRSGADAAITEANARTVQPLGTPALIAEEGESTRAYDPETLTAFAPLPKGALTAAANAERTAVAWCERSSNGQGLTVFVATAPDFQPRKLSDEKSGSCGQLRWMRLEDEPAIGFFSGLELSIHPVDGSAPRSIEMSGPMLSGIEAFEFAPDGKSVAIETNNVFQLIGLPEGKELRKPPFGFAPTRLKFSPDGRSLALGGSDGRLEILTFAPTDTSVIDLEPLSGWVSLVAFSADNKIFAAALESGECQVYDARTGRLVARVTQVGDERSLFIETPDGRFDAPESIQSRVFEKRDDAIVPLRRAGYTPGLLGQVFDTLNTK
jgi:WD40 repeat protein